MAAAGGSEARTSTYAVRAGQQQECAAPARGPAVGPEGRKGRRIRRRQCKEHRARNAQVGRCRTLPSTAIDWRRHCVCVLAQDRAGLALGPGLGAFELNPSGRSMRTATNSTTPSEPGARGQCKEPKTGGLWAAGGFQTTGRARGCPGLPLLDRGPRTKPKDKLVLKKKRRKKDTVKVRAQDG